MNAKAADRDRNDETSDTIIHWACATREILARVVEGLDPRTGLPISPKRCAYVVYLFPSGVSLVPGRVMACSGICALGKVRESKGRDRALITCAFATQEDRSEVGYHLTPGCNTT